MTKPASAQWARQRLPTTANQQPPRGKDAARVRSILSRVQAYRLGEGAASAGRDHACSVRARTSAGAGARPASVGEEPSSAAGVGESGPAALQGASCLQRGCSIGAPKFLGSHGLPRARC